MVSSVEATCFCRPSLLAVVLIMPQCNNIILHSLQTRCSTMLGINEGICTGTSMTALVCRLCLQLACVVLRQGVSMSIFCSSDLYLSWLEVNGPGHTSPCSCAKHYMYCLSLCLSGFCFVLCLREIYRARVRCPHLDGLIFEGHLLLQALLGSSGATQRVPQLGNICHQHLQIQFIQC